VKLDLAMAQLCIADGVWQEAPDNIARFYEFTLFGEGVSRGSLYIVTEVFGDPEGRDDLAREVIETVRREYAASRGSISASLAGAIRIANDFFFETNAGLPAEARRIAGITAAVLREDELFIAQAGPGVVCLVRDGRLQRFPETSPWFNAEERPIYDDEFVTPGTVPIGKRRNYVPDLFHVTLQPGDTVALSTRTLVHLLSNEEIVDTFANRHPDEISKSLEELAGAGDLSVIILHVVGQITTPSTELPADLSVPPIEEPAPEPVMTLPAVVEEPSPEIEPVLAPTFAEPREEELLRQRESEDKARARQMQWRAAFLKIVAGVVAGIAGLLGRFNATNIGTTIDRVIAGILRGTARVIVFLLRAIAPGTPAERTERPASAPRSQTAWQLASLVLPVVLIIVGVSAWVMYRVEQQRLNALEVEQLVTTATSALERADQLAGTDKNAARNAAQQAFEAAQQARTTSPNDPRVSKVYYNAKDALDKLNGIAILYPQTFLTLSEAQANPRIVASYPNLFVLDRGLSRIYRFTVTDAGASPASTASNDGMILKAGEKVGERTVGQLIDLAIVDSKRLVVLDRTGLFWVYDIERATWSARAALDAVAWSRVNLVASYANNVYLLDAPNNQILKYVPNADGWWTAATTFFNPGANPNTSNVVDMTIDGDVWLLRNTGALVQCTAARCNEIVLRDLEIPLMKPVAAFTAQTLAALYIADAGNRRIVQIDKSTSRFARQFKPSAQQSETFSLLKALTADDKKFYFINENKAYLATIPAPP
jgi:serine/threonine protein phosphatase PrpC